MKFWNLRSKNLEKNQITFLKANLESDFDDGVEEYDEAQVEGGGVHLVAGLLTPQHQAFLFEARAGVVAMTTVKLRVVIEKYFLEKFSELYSLNFTKYYIKTTILYLKFSILAWFWL